MENNRDNFSFGHKTPASMCVWVCVYVCVCKGVCVCVCAHKVYVCVCAYSICEWVTFFRLGQDKVFIFLDRLDNLMFYVDLTAV